jgi:DNA-binding NarL/FixJ family response regulator
MEVLQSNAVFEVIGTATSGTLAVSMALELKPDLIILDVMIPEISGVEVLRRLKNSLPKMRVLVFSAKQEPQVVRGLIQEGMHGFVNKHSPLKELREAITIVANGGIWFDEKFSQTVRDALAKPTTVGDGMIDLLTPREREISMLIARSHSSKDVAALLNISVKTSENHRANLMRKLGVRDVAGLVRLAIRHGLVDPTQD